MNIIKLNDTEFPIVSFNRNIYFYTNTVSSTASCDLGTMTPINQDKIDALSKTVITSLQIYHDDELIYNLSDIHAFINNINDMLSEDHIVTTINLTFDIA